MHANPSLIRRAARWLSAAFLLAACTLVLALPAPKDIEAAVNAGHLTQAETMLREVLHEKPGSARAHYELGQVLAREAKYQEALVEVQRAKDIDSSLKFASSPEKFQQTLQKIEAATSAATLPATTTIAPAVVATTPPTPTTASTPSLNLNYVLLGIAALVVVALLIRRSQAQAAPANPVYPTAAGGSGFGAQFTPNVTAYPGPGYAPGYGAPMQGGSGSGVGGAVLGGVAGLAAGYALSKALEGDHHSSPNAAAQSPGTNGAGYVPFDAPTPPDFGSFDAGSGDSWDNSGGGGSDDNW